VIRRLLKQIAFVLADDYYDICISKHNRLLQGDFRRILTNSRKFLYLSYCSSKPLFMRDEFRDMVLNRIYRKEPGVDLKILVNLDLFPSLTYYDGSFRTTTSRVGDFVIGDAGTMVVIPHQWNLLKIRKEYPGEDITRKFLDAYNASPS
jgi:hypothetical protein